MQTFLVSNPCGLLMVFLQSFTSSEYVMYLSCRVQEEQRAFGTCNVPRDDSVIGITSLGCCDCRPTPIDSSSSNVVPIPCSRCRTVSSHTVSDVILQDIWLQITIGQVEWRRMDSIFWSHFRFSESSLCYIGADWTPPVVVPAMSIKYVDWSRLYGMFSVMVSMELMQGWTGAENGWFF